MLFTLGHSTLSEREFVQAARGIDCIVDVRSHPGSRHSPQFNRENMRRWLPDYGIRYEWWPGLGGWAYRHLAEWEEEMAQRGVDVRAYAGAFPKQRINLKLEPTREGLEWFNAGFRDYSYYMMTGEFLSSTAALIERYAGNGQDRAAMVCCEACVPGDTLVNAVGLQRAFRRRYRGPLLTIEIAGNHRLSVTPNHPILTPQGWVSADRLRQGDSAIGCLGLKNLTSIGVYPDIEHRPSPIAQVFDTLQGTSSRIVGRAVDFHGDITNGEIDVVTASGALRAESYSENRQVISKLALPELASHRLANLPRARQGAVEALVSGQMRSSVVSYSQPCTRRDLVPGQLRSLPRRTGLEPDEPEVLDHSGPAEAKLLAEGQYRFTGQELIHEILSVGVRQFEGYVYDLETTTGLYTAQGVTLRNCWWRCHRGMIADFLTWRGVPCYHLPVKPPKREATPRFKAHAEAIGNRLQRYDNPIIERWTEWACQEKAPEFT